MDKVKFCASLQALMTIDFSDVLFIFIPHDWEAENCICCFNCFSVHSYDLLWFLSLCLGAYLGESVGWPDICIFDSFLPTYLVQADINNILLASTGNLSPICKSFPSNPKTFCSLASAFQKKICSWWICIILAFLL